LTHRSASSLPPLLQRLPHRRPEALDYLGVSYGLTQSLLRFWKRAGYTPYYVRQTENDITGEFGCVMLKPLVPDIGFEAFAADFRRRFISLLSYKFREFAPVTALTILDGTNSAASNNSDDISRLLGVTELEMLLTPFDLKRLESYANNALDYHVVLDLIPTLGTLYFDRRLRPDVRLSAVQSAILLGLGLQRKNIEEVEKEVGVPVNQALALFVKLIRKLVTHLQDLRKNVIAAAVP